MIAQGSHIRYVLSWPSAPKNCTRCSASAASSCAAPRQERDILVQHENIVAVAHELARPGLRPREDDGSLIHPLGILPAMSERPSRSSSWSTSRANEWGLFARRESRCTSQALAPFHLD